MLHQPSRWYKSHSLWNCVSWNKLPITIAHIPSNLFYNCFSKLSGIWLIDSLMIIHDVANVFTSISKQWSNIFFFLKIPIVRHFWQRNLVQSLLHNSINAQNEWRYQALLHTLLHLTTDFLVFHLKLTIMFMDTVSWVAGMVRTGNCPLWSNWQLRQVIFNRYNSIILACCLYFYWWQL